MQTWCAIGDSFTYLNDHLDETDNIVARGYLSRALDKLPPLCLRNLGINGSTTRDWLTAPLAPADVYTILLGTNDWHQGIPLGDRAAFRDGAPGTILGNLGNLLGRLRALNPQARVLVCNPVERPGARPARPQRHHPGKRRALQARAHGGRRARPALSRLCRAAL